MRQSALALFLLPTLVAVGCTEGRGGGDDDDGPSTPLAAGLDIEGISLNQGVEVPLVQGGEDVSGSLPVIAGRPGRLHVYVDPQDGWEERDVIAALHIDGGDTLEETRTIGGASDLSDSDSFFAFDVPGDDLDADAGIRVTLHEASSGAGGEGDTAGASWPGDDSELLELAPRDSGGPIDLVIVPIEYNADGSGRLPDTSDAQLEVIRQRMLALYPAADVSVTAIAPLPWNSTISPFGQGWDTLLNAIAAHRDTTGASDNQYYYGLFDAMSSFSQWCGGGGCIMGLSILATQPNAAWSRASIGVGFTGGYASDTLVHEVGHAHGREHAPCGLFGQQSDPGYPHAEAKIGVWGWDIVEERYYSPTAAVDFMSYCDPIFVSDYTWDALHDRIVAVNAQADIAGLAPSTWQVSLVDGEGNVSAGQPLVLRVPPEGEAVDIELLDAHGGVLEVIEGFYFGLNHLPGGMILHPAPGPNAATARFFGGSLLPLTR